MAKNDPFAALRFPQFRYFITAQFLFTVAILVQEVVISYYLYEITHDPLSLGLVGLLEAIPYISVALFGGYFADKYNKKTIYLLSFAAVLIGSVILLWLTHASNSHIFTPREQIPIIYVVLFFLGFARGFYGPTWSSLKPFLVPAQHYSNSASWSSQFWQTGMIVGPASAGFLYNWLGLSGTLTLVIGLLVLVVFIASLISTKHIQLNKSSISIFQSLKEGIVFVRTNRILWYAILLDMFSVLFGGVVAILPVFAKDILAVGPDGLGILRAAPGIGAVLAMLGTAFFTPTHRPWRNMLIGVAGFGVATLVFAFSTNFWLSCAALFLTGAFDAISVVVRQTILQVLPPDDMRGRVSSVNGIFVSCSNELGAFESGVAAKVLGAVPSVIFGGVMTLSIVTVLYARTKELFAVRLIRK
ncbi:MAG: MFS transporter [Spirosomataceae bacterium]